MAIYRDYLDELFVDKLGYEPVFQSLTKPAIDGSDNLLQISRDYKSPTGSVAVIVVICKDRLPHFQKTLIKEYKRTYPDAHFLFISNNGKVFDLYNYATSKNLRPITYSEIERNTKLFKEKIQFFNASSIIGSADLKVQIEKAFETTDKITKKFYDNFKSIHEKLTKAIKGIKDEADRKWYATTLLNRIMFIFFLQKNYVLQGDTDYLLTKFDQVKWKDGNYYKDFLLKLFFKGFAKKDNDPEKILFVKEFGDIKYLNGGLFYPNKIELKYSKQEVDTIKGTKKNKSDGTNPVIEISNNVLHDILKFLNGHTWYLDNRPTKDEKEINPDVLGYIFEKYINQKELGAYYTKEDITEYISKNTIIPFIFDKLRHNGYYAPDPAPLITNNEDIIAIADNYIMSCNDYGTLKFLYKDILQPLSVLDPAVGSGAFLFAGLNILLPIYQATVARLKTFKDKQKDAWLKTFLNNLSGHPEEYFLTKQIILNNLYGVDIVEEGVEICKLRLFLQLASHLADITSIEPLPDIDFNIYSGNSLVGGLSWRDLLGNYGLKLFTKDGDGFTEEELKSNIKNLKDAKQLYKRLQGDEDDEKKLKQQKAEVQRLENRINHCIDIGIENPFHWFVEFGDIFERGGFDVIIGNPPYVEYSKVKSEYSLKGFKTEKAGNLYAYFIERSMEIGCPHLMFGFIIPISFACTKRMEPAQRVIFNNNEASWISFFAERPDKLFVGADLSLCIVLSKKGKPDNIINTTRYIKWNASDRSDLFNELSFVNSADLIRGSSLPKIGNDLSKNILRKISKSKYNIGSHVVNISDYSVCFRNAGGRYFKIALNHEPEFKLNGQVTRSSTYKFIFLNSAVRRDAISSLLNSSLYYWYWIIYSDTWHMVNDDVLSFPIDLEPKLEQDLAALYKKLEKSYYKNSEPKTEYRNKGKDTISYTKFFAKKSKIIIDEIDDILGSHYGFNKQELNFIKNYDIQFRLGAEEE